MVSRNPDYIALINTARWRRCRSAVLAHEPLCRRCKEQGRVTAATEVHHIEPLESVPDPARRAALAYDLHNLMPLCHDCHAALHKEMKGKSGAAARSKAAAARFLAEWLDPPGGVFSEGEGP